MADQSRWNRCIETTRSPLLLLLSLLLQIATSPVAGAASEDPAAERPTFYGDVLPILQANCITCHRPAGLNLGGMVAPMSLVTYEEARPWARAIAKAVSSGEMPPWDAAPVHHGQFRNERSLTEAEIATLVRWAKAGAIRGSGEDIAIDALFSDGWEGWSIGEPDLVLTMPEPFLVADEVEDLYVDIVVPVPGKFSGSDRWIEALEFKAGSPAVHHVIAYAVLPGGSKFDPGAMLGGIAPGTDPESFPAGYGRLFPAGSTVVFEMHYHKEAGPGTEIEDRSQMAVKFHTEPVRHRVNADGIASWDFEIPAGAAHHEVKAEHTFAKDVTVLSLTPHMHLRGSEAKYVAFYPDGREELLLHVPRYDFNWQTSYTFAEPRRLPSGTRVEVTLWFDNSTTNPANPDPTVAVRYGEPTTDEMAIGWMNFTNTGHGDFELEPLFAPEILEALVGTSSSGGGGE